jgi:hypothetical protein
MKKFILSPPKWLVFAAVLAVFIAVGLKKLDPDFGWHLVSGQYFTAHGVPVRDIFTYTATNFTWVDHEWLSDIFLAWLYGLGGYNLLAVVYGLLWTLAFFLIGRRANGWIVLAAVLAVLPFAGIRSVMWSVLGLAILWCLLAKWDKNEILKIKHHKPFRTQSLLVAIIPLLIWAWANIHGGFVIGIAVLAFFSALKKSWKLAVVAACGALLALINPYGLGIYVEIWRTLSDGSLHGNITEWMPFWQGMDLNLALILILYGSAFAWSVTSAKRCGWRNFLTAENVFLLASLSSRRNWPLFSLAVIPYIQKNFRSLKSKIPAKIPRLSKIIFVVTSVAMLALGGYCAYFTLGGSWSRERNYPQAAVDYLKKNPCAGNLFNDYDFGGYLIWKLPEQKVFIDGRMPSWEIANGDNNAIDGKTFHKYFDLFKQVQDDKDKKLRNAVFDKYNVSCVLMGKNSGLAKNLTKEKWHQVIKKNNWVLFIKNKN